MTGAELIAQIDRMTMGWWRPSPGSIYPLLEQMEQEKLVQKNPDGRYQLTESGRSGPDWLRGMFPGVMGPRNPEDAVREIEAYARYLEDFARTDRDRMRAVSERISTIARRLESLTQSGVSSGPRTAESAGGRRE